MPSNADKRKTVHRRQGQMMAQAEREIGNLPEGEQSDRHEAAAMCVQHERRAAGRPYGTLLYDNVADLERGISDYYHYCDLRHAPYTSLGLAWWLGISYEALRQYGHGERDNTDYIVPIARARDRCRLYAMEAAYDRDKTQGAKLDLAANYGIAERQQLDITARQGAPEVAKLSDAELQQRLIEAAKDASKLQDADWQDA